MDIKTEWGNEDEFPPSYHKRISAFNKETPANNNNTNNRVDRLADTYALNLFQWHLYRNGADMGRRLALFSLFNIRGNIGID
jgi:hypothetical protein